ncbi:MAG: hypothetical protein IJG97_02720 [Bacilli bacterium]|nr:hypothetical protein [Bacilli bacterium]
MKILVSAETFGYGPISTCLSVARELKKYKDVTLDFIGEGIAMEQAKLSGLFDNYYQCNVFDNDSLEKEKKLFKTYDIFLSSENIKGAMFALKHVKNVYYIDNLVWMWDEIPEELGKVKKFFISETFSCKKNFKRIGHVVENPIFIGPIRNMKSKKSKKLKNQLIINVGGASTFMIDQNIINEFYSKLINDVLATPGIEKFKSIIICGGSQVINSLKIESDLNVEVKTLENKEYIKKMKESTHCIMSSGLGNFIETLNQDKEIMYLPAVNYSQLLQIDYYKTIDLGFSLLNWDSFDFFKEIPLYLEEQAGVDLVVENIKKYNSGNYRNKINESVKEYLDNSQKEYFKKRNRLFDQFDHNAAKTVASTIYDENK